MKKIAVVLSGCGHRDGSEITESVSLIVGLSQLGAQMEFFAPNIDVNPVNHFTGEVSGEKRNLLLESARITRGQSKDLANLKAYDFQALVFVGGMGAASHLSTWSAQGANCTVISDVQHTIESFYSEKKPIGAICIAPVLLAKVLGHHEVLVTIGNDPGAITEILKTGAHHAECSVTDIVIDRKNLLVTTPAYMFDAAPHKIFTGINRLSEALVKMA